MAATTKVKPKNGFEKHSFLLYMKERKKSMKKEDILALSDDLRAAAELSGMFKGASEDKILGIQERLVKTLIASFFEDSQKQETKETYKAPIPKTTQMPMIPKTDESKEPASDGAPIKEMAAENDDDAFMRMLANQIAQNPPKNKSHPLKNILTESVFKRAYSIAGNEKELCKRLGISMSAVKRLWDMYSTSLGDVF